MIYLGTFSTTRRALNEMIAAYIAKDQKLNGLTVSLTAKTISVTYTLSTLGSLLRLPVTITFTPNLSDEHHLVLTLDTFSESIFKGPRGLAFEKIAEQFKLPMGVSLNSEQCTVTLDLPKLINQPDLDVRLQTIDLAKDQFQATIFKTI